MEHTDLAIFIFGIKLPWFSVFSIESGQIYDLAIIRLKSARLTSGCLKLVLRYRLEN